MRKVVLAWLVGLVLSLLLGVPGVALAKVEPLSKDAKKGLKLAKDGDCVAAVPVLESAESSQHRPVTAQALAGCHVALGELLLAHEILKSLAAESPSAAWSKEDRRAHTQAKADAVTLDARIPRVTVSVTPDVPFELMVGGVTKDASEPLRIAPDEKTVITVTAPGFADFETTVLASEAEDKELKVTLVPLKKPPPSDPPKDESQTHWLGVGVRGVLLPQFLVNAMGEGGQTFFFPGGELRYSERLGSVDLEPSISILSLGAGTFPFKPSGTPDTEWELIESDLLAMTLGLDILYRVPVTDSGSVEFRIGGGFGIGWAFFGEVYRWQSYPEDLQPGDPATYKKCKGPNSPAGSYRYCNQLDKDANRFGAPDAWWGDGGTRPTVYPWLSLPQLGFAFRPADSLFIDLQVGVTPIGLFTQTGARFAL